MHNKPKFAIRFTLETQIVEENSLASNMGHLKRKSQNRQRFVVHIRDLTTLRSL